MTAKSASDPRSKNIIFVHPDLGIGGAERLVVDAAVGLQSAGHHITVLTSYRDTNHCFDEARDGTLDVRVRGDAVFPPSLAGRLSILFQILRQLALVVSTGVVSNELKLLDPDIIIVDQLSACIPFFRLIYPKARILFYGHFPDRLLAKKGAGLARYLKKAYRVPFDALEGWSTGCADNIVVNSKFTRSVFRGAFPHMRQRNLKVIYPCVDTNQNTPEDTLPLFPKKKLLLSINRFEGKKNLALAVKAYASLSADERSRAKLVVAGGFDPRIPENNVTHRELQQLCDSLNLTHATFRSNDTLKTDMTTEDVDTLFLLSIPGELKQRLLHEASLLIYTPENEHFGIVPLEAMLAGVPVLATNTGGPLETVYDGRTGWLRSPDKVGQWTDVMRKPLIPSSASTLQKMGQAGRDRVLAEFSQTKMTESFDKEIQDMCQTTGARPNIIPRW
ncbi:mannosyltransferase, partial [Teratosphaeria nubilosa]